jgi:hypothetical protein
MRERDMERHAKLLEYRSEHFSDGREKARKTSGKARQNGWLGSCRLKGETK